MSFSSSPSAHALVMFTVDILLPSRVARVPMRSIGSIAIPLWGATSRLEFRTDLLFPSLDSACNTQILPALLDPPANPTHSPIVQQKMLQTLRSDPQTSEEEHFKLVLVQTEVERVKFLIRSYVRTRLAKVRNPCPSFLPNRSASCNNH